MTNKYDWLIKKTPRSVDAMRLWGANPRLNPEEDYLTTTDFAEEMTSEDKDRRDFIALIKSIVENGFIPADPVVLWQDEENNKYYVAEGNRRVLALKLLRHPKLAPKAIRATILKMARGFDKEAVAKIPVSVAPTFEDAEWYISQRNSMSSLHKRWEAEQQRRWVMELYVKYDGDINKIRGKINLSEADLKKNIRILKLKELVKEVKDKLTEDEYQKAISIRFPITTFERFFTSSAVQSEWGITFEDYDFHITADRNSFLSAFAEAIKAMILPKGIDGKIDSRAVGTVEDTRTVLEKLPKVEGRSEEEVSKEEVNLPEESLKEDGQQKQDNREEQKHLDKGDRPKPPKDDPQRIRLIHESYQLQSDQYRLIDLFGELKRIPFLYPNSIAASIRIFLDLSVLNYIETEALEPEITKKYKSKLREVTLKQRLEFIKQVNKDAKVESVLSKFLNPSNQFSLDVLNGYQHNQDHHFIEKRHLNQFWDFLMPLFRKLVAISEDE